MYRRGESRATSGDSQPLTHHLRASPELSEPFRAPQAAQQPPEPLPGSQEAVAMPVPRPRMRPALGRSRDLPKMAALRAVLGCRGAPPLLPRPGQSRGASGGRLLRDLGRWFYEAETAASWGERLRRLRLRRKSAYYRSLQETYGVDVAAAVFTLSCGGGVRFEGDETWIRPDAPWRPEHLCLHDTPVAALDLSGTSLDYDGLDNLVPLTRLRQLDLSCCPQLDDWALGRLHVFRDTLWDLSLARCPRVTERGLATLHHLRELRRLDVAGLRVPSAGLIRILLEEELPNCQVLGVELGDDVGTMTGGEMPPPA